MSIFSSHGLVVAVIAIAFIWINHRQVKADRIKRYARIKGRR